MTELSYLPKEVVELSYHPHEVVELLVELLPTKVVVDLYCLSQEVVKLYYFFRK